MTALRRSPTTRARASSRRPVARTYQVVDGTSTRGPNYSSHQGQALDYIRGGTVYWTGSCHATPSTLVRTDSRYVTRGPFQQKVYRIGKDRSNNAVGVYPVLPAARA